MANFGGTQYYGVPFVNALKTRLRRIEARNKELSRHLSTEEGLQLLAWSTRYGFSKAFEMMIEQRVKNCNQLQIPLDKP